MKRIPKMLLTQSVAGKKELLCLVPANTICGGTRLTGAMTLEVQKQTDYEACTFCSPLLQCIVYSIRICHSRCFAFAEKRRPVLWQKGPPLTAASAFPVPGEVEND